MELWVRSQEKDILLKVKSLLIDDDNYDIYTQDYVGQNLCTYTLGTYKSKERALEVLDEIQNTIIGFENENNYVSTQCYAIYEMPSN